MLILDRRMALVQVGLGATVLKPLFMGSNVEVPAPKPRHVSNFPKIPPQHDVPKAAHPKHDEHHHHHDHKKHPHHRAESLRAQHTLDTPGRRRDLALTMWGEARNHGEGGMRAVGHVILNRAKYEHRFYGFGIQGVCHKRKQFSCWNAGDPNREHMKKLPKMDEKNPDWKTWVIADKLAAKLLTGTDKDTTGGATFYCATYMTPYWRNDMIIVGVQYGHAFYLPKKHLFRKKKKCRSVHHGHKHHQKKYHGRRTVSRRTK